MVGRSLLWGIGEGGRWQDFSAGRRASVDPNKRKKYCTFQKWMSNEHQGRVDISSNFNLKSVSARNLDGFKRKKVWLFTIYNDEQGERLGSDLQGKFSTIKLPLRLREKLRIVVEKCCSRKSEGLKG